MVQYPLVSIILILQNAEEHNTAIVLDQLKFCTEIEKHELLLIDNTIEGSMAGFIQSRGFSLIDIPQQSYCQVLNQAIMRAKGKFVCIISEGTIVTKNWLVMLLKRLNDSPKLGIVAPMDNYSFMGIPRVDVNIVKRSDLEEVATYLTEKYSGQYTQCLHVYGNCILIKKEVFSEIGYFDHTLLGMFWSDFCLRAVKESWEIAKQKDAFVYCMGDKERSEDYAVQLQQGKLQFKKKWGFSFDYSVNVREDMLKFIDFSRKNLAVLEVGCACGATLLRIKEKAPNAMLYGVELDGQAGEVAKNIADIKNVNIELNQKIFEQKSFDYILFGDVLEHLYNPQLVVTNMKDLLKADGAVIASIPNVMHISNVRSLLNGNWQYTDSGILDRTHVRFFTLREMVVLFRQAGYNQISYMPINNYISEENERFLQNLLKIDGINGDTEQFKALQYIIIAKK